MLKKLIIILCVLIILVLCPASDSVLYLTDSTGYRIQNGKVDNKGFPSGEFFGVCGGMTPHLFLSYVARYGDEHFDKVIIRVGGNDLVTDAVVFKNFLKQIINNGSEPIVIKWESINPDDRVKSITNMQESICKEMGVKYVVCGLTEQDFSDGIHLNQSGVEKTRKALDF